MTRPLTISGKAPSAIVAAHATTYLLKATVCRLTGLASR